MTCYNPKPTITEWYKKLNEKTGEIYWTKKSKFLNKYNDFNPLDDKITMIPCGKCAGCRIDKASEWATRAYLESKNWKENCFLTLTYNNEHLPKNRTLVKRDLQLFWKKLRKKNSPLRYMACGEY